MSKIVCVGDSTLSKFNDVSYYFDRHGYATTLDKYFNLNVMNLALSGRSSKSFLVEKEYQIMLDNLEAGDFLVIGFGHNDEKEDDKARFSSALLDTDTLGSFKNNLYYKYAKIALDRKATPILCTPIVRLSLNNDYSGNIIHQTKNGDYRKAIIELGKEKNIFVVDLTNLTKKYMESIDSDTQFIQHAISKGKKINNTVTYDIKSVDKAHLSYLGALYVSYLFKEEIKKSNLELKKYIINDDFVPKKSDLKVNSTFKFKDYVTPDLDNYKPKDIFKTTDKDYYGTAFGMLESKIGDSNYNLFAYQDKDKFIVGQKGLSPRGKLNASCETFAYLFRRVDKNLNFTFECKAKVIKEEHVRQTAFGIMLRNDCYINQEEKNESYNTNYIASGFLTTDVQTYMIFARENPTELIKSNNVLPEFYGNIECNLKIERLGQVITAYLEYDGKSYKEQFIDFDILALDSKYLYIGMFSNGGTIVEYSDVKFEITGNAISA
ncbi:MAG: hypothetical protein K6E20_06505 [Acholeplasmatales bacterium]|nr:hypothetical protein [Acholeplasmatales bacterium]